MKKILSLIFVMAVLSASAQKGKAQCSVPPAPKVSNVSFSYATNFYCNGDSVYCFTVSVPDKYSNASGSVRYIFKFTGITNPMGGCQDISAYGLHSKTSKYNVYFSKCSGCFSFGQTYTVAVEAMCANGYGTGNSPAVSFTLQKPLR